MAVVAEEARKGAQLAERLRQDVLDLQAAEQDEARRGLETAAQAIEGLLADEQSRLGRMARGVFELDDRLGRLEARMAEVDDMAMDEWGAAAKRNHAELTPQSAQKAKQTRVSERKERAGGRELFAPSEDHAG